MLVEKDDRVAGSEATKPSADHPMSALGVKEHVGKEATVPLPGERSGSSVRVVSRLAKVSVEPVAAVRSKESRTVLVHQDDRLIGVALDQKPIVMRLPPTPSNARPLVPQGTRPAVAVVHDGTSNKSPASVEPAAAVRSEESRDVVVQKDDRIAASDEASTKPVAEICSLGAEEQVGQAATAPSPDKSPGSSLRVASRPPKVSAEPESSVQSEESRDVVVQQDERIAASDEATTKPVAESRPPNVSVEPAPAVQYEESRAIVVHKDDRIVAATLDHEPMLKRFPPQSGSERPLVRLETRPGEVFRDVKPSKSPRANRTASPFRDQDVYGGLALIRQKMDAAFDLATRGAFYSARSALLESLKLLAAHLDASEGTSRHREALAAAFQCVDEAEDFLPSRHTNMVLDVVGIAAGHRTPLADSLPQRSTAAEARAMYYRYAIAQFSRAFPDSRDASLALHGLGKLADRIGNASVPRVANVSGRAIVFQRAALALNEANGLAANELGVLLNRAGQRELASGWLYRSAHLTNRPKAWRNLVIVLRCSGETEMANVVQRNVNRLGHREIRRQPAVNWVSPARLAAGKPRDSDWPSRRR